MTTAVQPERAKLTLRRERFAQAYARTLNLSRAARLAGFSARSAARYGWHLYHDVPAVRARVEELLAEYCREFEQQFAASSLTSTR